MWDTSCRDWQARIKAGQSLIPALPLIKAPAAKALGIFNHLQLPDVIGQPRMATAAGEWQRDLVRAIFGAWDEAAQERLIREYFVMVPKKSSKTTMGAAIMVTALMMNKRPRAEFLFVAPTQEVSDLAFRQAVGMIQADPVLFAKFVVHDYIKRIVYLDTLAFLKVKSFDPKIVTGSKPSGVLLDELHVIATAPEADRVIGQLRGGLISQPEAFMLTITTQSERPPAGVFRTELGKARNVRDGKLKAPLLPVLYEFPDGVDWQNPDNWAMVTPNNGYSLNVARLVPDFDGARDAGEAEFRRWASQHLNVEIGLGLRTDGWAGADLWEKQGDPGLDLDAILARSDCVVVGIDGGGADDLLGLAVLGRDAETRDWLLWCKAWAQRIVLERRKSIASNLRDFAEAGELTIVDEPGPEIDEIADLVQRIDQLGLLAQVGLDPMGVGEIIDALAERGIEGGTRVVGVPQGWRLSGAIKTCERKLANRTLHHGAQPLMAWAVGNARVEPRGNAVAIDKAAAGSAKIDPVVALLCAAALMSRNPEPAGGRSIFEDAAWDSSPPSVPAAA